MAKKKTETELKDLSFSELVDSMAINVHSRLLLEGGSGLKQAVGVAMETALRWRDERNEKPS